MRCTFNSEHLKAVPDTLESLISEKRLLQAAVLLVRSLKTVSRSEMLEIGAISDLRSYLTGQETVCYHIFTIFFITNFLSGFERNSGRRASCPSLCKDILVRVEMGLICSWSTG